MKTMSSDQPDLDQLPPDLRGQIVALLAHKDDIIERLEALVKDFKQALFGAKSEKADPEQYALAFEDIETALAAHEAEQADSEPEHRRENKPSAMGRGHLPKHLEMMFSKLKTLLRKAAERTIEGLWSTIGTLLNQFSQEECRNYLKHAVYGWELMKNALVTHVCPLDVC